jgi:DNA-binding transcriptional regulator YdaS (Cro superfamily)
MNKHIAQAISLLGGQAALARACGRSQVAINLLARGIHRPSAETAISIERATRGVVTREQLRPDLFLPAKDTAA